MLIYGAMCKLKNQYMITRDKVDNVLQILHLSIWKNYFCGFNQRPRTVYELWCEAGQPRLLLATNGRGILYHAVPCHRSQEQSYALPWRISPTRPAFAFQLQQADAHINKRQYNREVCCEANPPVWDPHVARPQWSYHVRPIRHSENGHPYPALGALPPCLTGTIQLGNSYLSCSLVALTAHLSDVIRWWWRASFQALLRWAWGLLFEPLSQRLKERGCCNPFLRGCLKKPLFPQPCIWLANKPPRGGATCHRKGDVLG